MACAGVAALSSWKEGHNTSKLQNPEGPGRGIRMAPKRPSVYLLLSCLALGPGSYKVTSDFFFLVVSNSIDTQGTCTPAW